MIDKPKEKFLRGGYEQNSVGYLLKRIFWRLIRPLPDRLFIPLQFLSIKGKWPNIHNPKTFCEKVQYRKLYDRNPLYGKLVDKIAVKDYIASRIGPEHAIPTYWTGTDIHAVDWDKIPLPAVIKPNHASALGLFLYTRSDIDDLLRNDPTKDWLAVDHARFNREWAYSQVQRKLVIEKMLSKDGGVPWDYRCFVFDGKVSHIIVDTRIDNEGYSATYTPHWERLPFYDPDYYPHCPHELPRPLLLDKMVELASEVGKGIDFVRVDFFDTGDQLYIGELTFYPGGGYEAFDPPEYDRIIGDRWTIPSLTRR
ncbi:polysaccharide biosynthesis protein [Peteryoungia desertarenae]|uniref:Polysaccharide biosynthesis protein n=1 Tax=Peteryoungia desertarenae TaxID=1813451 RepID=A0ABX6QIM8_9HYPH|nr:ATP-grasp fold amidoligase family protein [Peteryoungia desertarenae]QLF68413.1 polysaccharide biosynthesis protein [Peteryoungia desertarenae]